MTALYDLADNRQARGGPRLKAPYEVGRTRESKVLQCRRCEARLIALVADEDDSPAEIAAQARIVLTGGRVAAPFENVPRVEDRAGDEPVARALDVGADVDDDRAIAHGLESVVDGHPGESPSRAGQQLIDCHPRPDASFGTMSAVLSRLLALHARQPLLAAARGLA